MSYWIKICSECEQGRLIVMKQKGGGLFLLCEECENAWAYPEDVGVVNEAFVLGYAEIEYATSDDIVKNGWGNYKIIAITAITVT